jgi:hypothetical protein
VTSNASVNISDSVPAITEAAVTGQTGEMFADIRRVLGVDVVNLIWRHLATMPGALPWAWATLRPLYADGSIAGEAAALHGDLDLPRLPSFPAEVFAAMDLRGDDISTIRDVLAAYDRTNAMALVALSTLLRRLEDEPRALTAASLQPTDAPYKLPPPIPLPSLPSMAELAPPTAELVLILNRLSTRRDDAILASMYRHLAYWPAYLPLAWTLIAPLYADRSLDLLIANAAKKARERSARLVMRLHVLSAGSVDPALSTAIRSAIEPFTGDVIAKIVVICAVLRAAASGKHRNADEVAMCALALSVDSSSRTTCLAWFRSCPGDWVSRQFWKVIIPAAM